MATILRSAKGCVITVHRGSSSGFYRLRPDLNGGASSPILIDGMDGGEQDSAFTVSTLDRKKFIYVFGDDFGNIRVNGTVLLGKAEQGGSALNSVQRYWDANRISRRKQPIQISIPGNTSLRFYLTAIVIAAPNAIFHAQPFFYQGIVVEPKAP
jgi:hypothetical protein